MTDKLAEIREFVDTWGMDTEYQPEYLDYLRLLLLIVEAAVANKTMFSNLVDTHYEKNYLEQSDSFKQLKAFTEALAKLQE